MPAGSMGRWLCLAAVLLLIPLTCHGRVDPASSRIRTLYVGDAWTTAAIKETLGWIGAEPRFSIQIVPADLEFMTLAEAWRYTRLYLPRRYEDLNLSYDIVVLHNISPMVIETKVLNYLQQGMGEEGIGLALITFYFWGGTNDMPAWVSIPFYSTFPCDVLWEQIWGSQGKIFIRVVQAQPIMDLPGIEQVPMQGPANHGADILPRPGSVTHAIWEGTGTPFLVTGSYGRGETLQLATGWHIIGMRNYPYLPDFIYNQLYYVAGVSPPSDVALARHARQLFIGARLRRLVTLSCIEFADKFGANLAKVEVELGRLESDVERAERSYLEGDYDGAVAILEQVMEELPVIEAEVTRLRNQGMVWIHFTEWLVVCSTLLLSGTAIWGLMVSRKAFREVGQSRLRPG